MLNAVLKESFDGRTQGDMLYLIVADKATYKRLYKNPT